MTEATRPERLIMLAVPNSGQVNVELLKSIVMIITEADFRKFGFMFVPLSLKCNENCYQTIAKKFWESDADFLLQIDSDNPPIFNPLELCELDKDIISLATPTWKYEKGEENYQPVQWNAYRDLKNGRYEAIPPGKGLQEVDAVGSGCVLIAKRVFDAPLMRKEGWHRVWNKEDGTADLGLDLAFSKRARKCGFKTYVHWDFPCRHINEVDLATLADGFEQWRRCLGLKHPTELEKPVPEEVQKQWSTLAPPLGRVTEGVA